MRQASSPLRACSPPSGSNTSNQTQISGYVERQQSALPMRQASSPLRGPTRIASRRNVLENYVPDVVASQKLHVRPAPTFQPTSEPNSSYFTSVPLQGRSDRNRSTSPERQASQPQFVPGVATPSQPQLVPGVATPTMAAQWPLNNSKSVPTSAPYQNFAMSSQATSRQRQAPVHTKLPAHGLSPAVGSSSGKKRTTSEERQASHIGPGAASIAAQRPVNSSKPVSVPAPSQNVVPSQATSCQRQGPVHTNLPAHGLSPAIGSPCVATKHSQVRADPLDRSAQRRQPAMNGIGVPIADAPGVYHENDRCASTAGSHCSTQSTRSSLTGNISRHQMDPRTTQTPIRSRPMQMHEKLLDDVNGLASQIWDTIASRDDSHSRGDSGEHGAHFQFKGRAETHAAPIKMSL